jgi:RHS repeat-associated protein
VTYGYDARSQQTAVTDALTHQTTYGFDGLGRQTSVTDPRGGQTTYGYDLAGNLTALTDSVGNQTTYSYDAADRLTSTTDPLGHATTSAYDVANQLTSTTDRDGRTMTMAYDAAGRLTNVTWVSGSYTATYTYDKDGEVTAAQDAFSQYTMTYNAAGLVKSVDNGGTTGVPHVSLTMAYDGFLNRTSLTDSLGGQVSFGYDLAHKLTSDELFLNSAWKANVTIGYDAAGRLTGITRTAPRGHTITSSLGYDNADRLTNITHQDATLLATLDSYTYGYDNANRLTSYQDGNSSLTYGYDNAHELTSASGTLNRSSFNATYSYDLNGNRNMTGYSTGTGNELKSDGTYSYTYDNEGNLTTQTTIASGSVTYYSYDYRNLMTEVKQEDSHGNVLNDEKFTYDIHGNRIGVSNNGTQQSYTVFDGANPYIDFNGSGTLTERYLTNPQALGQFYARVDGSGTVNWYLTDNVHSVRQIVDAVGTVQDKLVYDPFGSIVSETNAANGDRFKYTGGQYDSVTGNDQFGARAYGSWAGRFWSQDPIQFEAGDSDLYRYVGNDPMIGFDSTGLIGFVGVQDGTFAGWNLPPGTPFKRLPLVDPTSGPVPSKWGISEKDTQLTHTLGQTDPRAILTRDDMRFGSMWPAPIGPSFQVMLALDQAINGFDEGDDLPIVRPGGMGIVGRINIKSNGKSGIEIVGGVSSNINRFGGPHGGTLERIRDLRGRLRKSIGKRGINRARVREQADKLEESLPPDLRRRINEIEDAKDIQHDASLEGKKEIVIVIGQEVRRLERQLGADTR